MNPKKEWSCMNYGYYQSSGIFIDEITPEVYCLQLYHYISSGLFKLSSLKGLKLIEIGSGRGGGLDYIVRTFHTHTAVGIEYSQEQVAMCNLLYSRENLMFIQGDAENLPISSESVDAVLNIESSHCYGDYKKFLGEVSRVVKKKGHFFYADFVRSSSVREREEWMNELNLKIFDKKDITQNVVMSMDLENKRKVDSLGDIPRILRRPLIEFMGMHGSRIYEQFTKGELVYLAYHIVKQ